MSWLINYSCTSESLLSGSLRELKDAVGGISGWLKSGISFCWGKLPLGWSSSAWLMDMSLLWATAHCEGDLFIWLVKATGAFFGPVVTTDLKGAYWLGCKVGLLLILVSWTWSPDLCPFCWLLAYPPPCPPWCFWCSCEFWSLLPEPPEPENEGM